MAWKTRPARYDFSSPRFIAYATRYNVSVTNLDSRTSLLPRQNNFPLVDLNIKHYTVKDTQVSNVSKDTTYIYIYI